MVTGKRCMLLAVLAFAAVELAGCRKQTAPDFYAAKAAWTILVTDLGDDAYSDPRMEAIVARLKEVPPRSLEAGEAALLLEKIDAERKRVAAHDSRVAAEVARAARGTLPQAVPDVPRDAARAPAEARPEPPAPAAPRPLPELRRFAAWRTGESGYRSAVAEQASSDCPLLVYVGVTWCPYCKQLDTVILPDPKVGAELSTAVRVRIDPEQSAAEKQIADRYGVHGYPTVLLITAPGEAPAKLDTGVNKTAPKLTALQADYHAKVGDAWKKAAYDSLRAARFDEAITRADRLIAFDPRAPDGYGYQLRAEAFRNKGDVAAALRDYQLGCAAGCTACCLPQAPR